MLTPADRIAQNISQLFMLPTGRGQGSEDRCRC